MASQSELVLLFYLLYLFYLQTAVFGSEGAVENVMRGKASIDRATADPVASPVAN